MDNLRFLGVFIFPVLLTVSCGGGSSGGNNFESPLGDDNPTENESGPETEPAPESPVQDSDGMIDSNLGESGNPIGSSDSQSSSAGFLQIGTLFFSQIRHQNELFVSASFSETESRYNLETQGRPQVGECFYFGPGSSNFDSGQEASSSSDFMRISAGEVIVINSLEGTYVNLPRTVSENSIFYSDPVDVPLPLPVPDNLTVNIPGDDFPTFQAVAVPTVTPLLVTQPESPVTLTASTVYRWIPDPSGQSIMTVNLFADDENFSVLARCETEDDGEFSLPIDIQTSMGDLGISGISSIARVSRRFLVDDDSQLQISVSNSQRLGSL